jgi:nicotinate-nucleotide pyrophosphorylase
LYLVYLITKLELKIQLVHQETKRKYIIRGRSDQNKILQGTKVSLNFVEGLSGQSEYVRGVNGPFPICYVPPYRVHQQ